MDDVEFVKEAIEVAFWHGEIRSAWDTNKMAAVAISALRAAGWQKVGPDQCVVPKDRQAFTWPQNNPATTKIIDP